MNRHALDSALLLSTHLTRVERLAMQAARAGADTQPVVRALRDASRHLEVELGRLRALSWRAEEDCG